MVAMLSGLVVFVFFFFCLFLPCPGFRIALVGYYVLCCYKKKGALIIDYFGGVSLVSEACLFDYLVCMAFSIA